MISKADKRKLLSLILASGLVSFLAGCHHLVSNSADDYVEIFHTNDMHSHFAGTKGGNACIREEGCEGGYGAIASIVAQQRKNNPDALFLNAGDKFQGSLLYVNHKSPLVSEIDNEMGYQAATLGNHECDEGCEGLLKFIKSSRYPFIAANLDPQKSCPLRQADIPSYTIVEYKGQKIGLIGLANPDVYKESGACKDTIFTAPIKAVEAAVNKLEKNGINKIILISHLGLPFDIDAAKKIKGLDVIIGGHTHDYIGPNSPIGPYPLVEKNPAGEPVLIVTTSGEAKYLGHLKVKFSESGIPVQWKGEPIKVGKAGGHSKITEIIDKAASSLADRSAQVIGQNSVSFPDGLDPCREGDCLSASLVTDAMLKHTKKNGAVIALINGGSFRGSLPIGAVTQGDLDNLQPFKDVLEVKEYTGSQLARAIEHGVSDLDGIGPRILQTSGLRYSYIPTNPVGKRVQAIEIKTPDGKYVPLNPKGKYIAAINTFLANGGDGHEALGEGKIIAKTNEKIPEIFAAWLAKNSPITTVPEHRISKLESKTSF